LLLKLLQLPIESLQGGFFSCLYQRIIKKREKGKEKKREKKRKRERKEEKRGKEEKEREEGGEEEQRRSGEEKTISVIPNYISYPG